MQKGKHICDAGLLSHNTHFGISSEKKTLFTIGVSKEDAKWCL